MKKIIKKIIHYFLKKNNVVTLQDFKESVKRIANGKYHSVRVELSQHSPHGGEERPIEVTYECYIIGYGFHNGAAMDEAINKLKEAMKNPKIIEVPTVVI